MSFLKLNGISVPILLGTASPEIEAIGNSSRALDNSLSLERRAVKGIWGFEVAHQTPAVALAFRDLLLGRAHSWSFDSHLYSSKGIPVTSAGAIAVSATQKKWGAKSCEVAASTTVVVAGLGHDFATLPWTASFWWWNGATWVYVVETSENIKYDNGVAAGARTFIAPTTDTLTLTNPQAAVRYLDDLWICFWAWPSTWPAAVYALASAVAPSPKLIARGTFVENDARDVTVQPEALTTRVMKATIDGTAYPNVHTVVGKLTEV